MRSSTLRRGVALVTGVAASVVWASAGPAAAEHNGKDGHRGSFVETRIVADQPGVAPVTDPDVVNPWGIAFGPTTPLWVANNGTSTSTLYSTATGATKVPLTVTTQPLPTGIVFNDTTEFALPDGTPTKFLFDSLTGELSGWAPGSTATVTATAHPGSVFTGLALAHTDDGARLYAADASHTIVRVYNGAWKQIDELHDPQLPAGVTPYNVAVIGKKLYVSYAPPPGVTASVNGLIDVFSLRGHFQRRLVTGGMLAGPWGMVKAPEHWGRFGGALLVGNEDGGAINAFNPHSGRFLGSLKDADGNQIGADGLWGMEFGNGVIGTRDDLVIAIGTDEYQHGTIALVHPSPKHHDKHDR